MKTVINPEYAEYEGLIREIPTAQFQFDQVYCNRRNLVGRVSVSEKSFVIKKYKRPTLANCVIYTWFRKNKAQRAYENALLLLARGIETAKPVAYIVKKKNGFFHTAYFVSEYLPYIPLSTMNKLIKSRSERLRIAHSFIDFTLKLHRSGIILRDNNAGNTLVYKKADGYHFALVDINRLAVGKVPNVNVVMKSFDQLGFSVKDTLILISQYTSQRQLDPEDSLFFILLHRRLHARRSRYHRWIRSFARVFSHNFACVFSPHFACVSRSKR